MDVYYTYNGRIVPQIEHLPKHLVRVHVRVLGGKGGFGSMLRAIGARIEKTTNREACRDLSGRRMRDVNNEKQIAEWLQEQEEKKIDQQKRREERNKRILSITENPKLEDAKYSENILGNAQNIKDALKMAKESKKATQTTTAKRPKHAEATKPTKKMRLWTGVDEDSGDSSSNEGESENENEEEAPNANDNHKPIDDKEREDVKEVGGGKDETRTEKYEEKNDSNLNEDGTLDLTEYKNAEELQVLGLQRLAKELKNRHLKTNGTLHELSERLFQNLQEQK